MTRWWGSGMVLGEERIKIGEKIGLFVVGNGGFFS